MMLMSDIFVVLSLLSHDSDFLRFVRVDDVSRLYCVVDGLPCRDFVDCLWFRDYDGEVVLVWRCPRFGKAGRK
jgi:hypothetical protein